MESESKLTRILTVTGIAIGVLLTVCVGIYLVATAAPREQGTTAIRWVVDPNPIRKEQIALFEAKHEGIRVINDPVPDSQRLLTQLAGGVPPDVMALYDPQTIRMFARQNVLEDLRPYVEQYDLPVDRLYPALKPYIYYDDKIVGIPENCGPYVFFYNRRLFREAGLDYPKPDWTWDQCLAAAKKLTKYRIVDGRRLPVQKGLFVSNGDWWFFIWMYGGRLFSDDGRRCLMDSAEVVRGIRYWADLRLKHGVMPTTSEAQSMAPTGSWGTDALLFRASKVAMVCSGRWVSIQYREQKGLEWDVVSVPHHPGHRFTLLASKSYAIPKACPHRDESIRFIRHLLDRDNQLLVANYGDGIPSVDDPELARAFAYNPEYPEERNNSLHLDEMKHARVQEFSPYINNLDVSAIMHVELDRMWLKEQTPDRACRNIAARINAIIRRNIANPNFLN